MRKRNSHLYLTRKQAENLIELGMKIKTPFVCFNKKHYWETEKDKLRLYNHNQCSEPVPTLTFQEIWDILPKTITKKGKKYNLGLSPIGGDMYIYYMDEDKNDALVGFSEGSILNSAYSMLVWAIEASYISNE